MKRRFGSIFALPGTRLVITLALLAILAWRLDMSQLLDRLSMLAPGWALLAVAIGFPQVVLSAWRWRMTSRRIGLPLSWPTAIREYYLATFLNQVLPGGVMGDAARAWRQGHDRTTSEEARQGPALRAVIIERASGQLVLFGVAIVAVVASSPLREGLAGVWRMLAGRSITNVGLVELIAAGLIVAGLMVAGLIIVAVRILPARSAIASSLNLFWKDLRRALLSVKIWPAQLLGSLLVVATYLAVFLCAAQALGIARPVGVLLPLIPPLLMAMAIPLTVAGWGLREGAAALIWPLAGLPAQEGVALSIAYGVLILAASLPGLVILLLSRRRAPRTARTSPAEPAPGGQPG